MSTNQIDAWTGEFGDAYHERQTDFRTEATKREQMWVQVLALMPRVNMDILEVGAGTGPNLEAIRRLYQSVRLNPALHALEPNEKAARHLSQNGFWAIPGSAQEIQAKDGAFDLVFTNGVLIHLPDPLPAMREIYRVSRRFVMCAEYFSPRREAIPYRDGVDLIKDDYGGLWMDNFDLKLVGYGFCWKRATGLDNVTWTLFERKDFVLKPMTMDEQHQFLKMTAG